MDPTLVTTLSFKALSHRHNYYIQSLHTEVKKQKEGWKTLHKSRYNFSPVVLEICRH